MQDKDMDELFGAKLNDFEMQPSALVWNNITNELDAGKSRKRLVPLLSIAASVIVLLAAGILFIPQKQNTTKNTRAVAKNTAAVLKVGTAKKVITTTPVVYASVSKGTNHPVEIIRVITKEKHTVTDTVKLVNTAEQPILANVSQQSQEVIKPVVPDEDITLKPMEIPVLGAKQTLANAQLPEADKQNVKPAKKKHRLNTFGDMVNAVVAKIDKRQNKFIEFSNTDGDEATITSVNLGLVKIKKEDKVDKVD